MANFVNDSLNGDIFYYYNNDKNSIEGIYHYENGITVGSQKTYYKNGHLKKCLGINYNQDIMFNSEYSTKGQLKKKEGNYKIMGVFKDHKLTINKRFNYKSYFAIPDQKDIIYNYSIAKIGAKERYKSIKLTYPIFTIDTIFKERGDYILKEKLTIHDLKNNKISTEQYDFIININ